MNDDHGARTDHHAGAESASSDSRGYGEGAGHAPDAGLDATGPNAAVGFGAWQATMADAGGGLPGSGQPGADPPGGDADPYRGQAEGARPGGGEYDRGYQPGHVGDQLGLDNRRGDDARPGGAGRMGVVPGGFGSTTPAPLRHLSPIRPPAPPEATSGLAGTGTARPGQPTPAPAQIRPEAGPYPPAPARGREPAAPGASVTPVPPPRPSAAAGPPAPTARHPVLDGPTMPAARTSMAAGLDALNLLDTLAEVVFRTDAEGCWTYLNPAWTRLTGFSIAESLGNRFISYVHPEEIEHTIALFMAVVVGGADHCHHETRYRIADGTYRRVQIRARVLRDDAGEVVGNMGTIIDVTDARFGAEMAGEQSALLELVPTGGKIDDLPVGVVIYDPGLTVRRASRVVDRLVGTQTRSGDTVDVLSLQLRPAALGGPALGGEWGLVATARRTRQAQIGDLDVLPARAAATQDAAAGRPAAGELQGASLGPVRSLRATVIPMHDDGDTQVAVVFSDITDLRRAERQQAALAYLGQRALTTLDVPALLIEAVELVASTLAVERCDLVECIEFATPAGGRASRAGFGEAHDDAAAASDGPGGPGGAVGVARIADVGGGGARPTGDVQAHVRACYGRHGGSWNAGLVSAAPGSFVWTVLSSRQPLVIDDLSGHSDIATERWLQGDGAVASVGAPIGVGSRAFGVLAAHSGTRRWFTKDEAHFVQSVANIIAAAVELAQMQEDRARLAVFEDRDRIACELHDLVIQRLFSVGLRLQSLTRLVAEPGVGRLSAAISDLDQTIDEVRRTIFDLRPPYA